MTWRLIGQWCGSALLCASLTTLACGPANDKSTFHSEIEGGKDDNRAFGATPKLGNPPRIDATAPAADYLVEVSTLIQPAWSSFLEDCRIRLDPQHPLNDPGLHARLELTIDGEGRVINVRVLKPSGNADFDGVALEVLGDLKALPAPPPEWISDDDRIRIGWQFARDIRQAGSAGASIQRVNLPLEEALERFLSAGRVDRAARRMLDAGGRSVPVTQLDALALRILALALGEEDNEVKARALHLVGALKLEQFREAARAGLKSSNPRVVRAALVALGAVGQEADIALLTDFTSGQRQASPAEVGMAATSLELLGQGTSVSASALASLSSSDEGTLLPALAVLAKLTSKEAVPLLSKMLHSSTRSRSVRIAAARALGRHAPQSGAALKALLRGLNSPDAALRASCLDAIAESANAKVGLRSPLAYRRVVRLINTKDERVRAAAIVAAAALAPSRFGRELAKIRAGGSVLVVMSIAKVLGEVPGDTALTRLLDLTKVPNVGMRVAAARGLAQRLSEEARFALQDLLRDASPRVRAAALRGVQGEKALRKHARDPALEVRLAAIGALVGELGKAKTAKLVTKQLASSGADRAAQVQWAKAWLVPSR